MSVFLVAALLAATASGIATGCVAYILISFQRSRHLLASRIGRQPVTLVLIEGARSRRRQSPKALSAHRPMRLQTAP